VALFTTTPVGRIRTIAADTSSRTSHVLLRILCLERFGIDPEFQPMAPEPELMLRRCDAALLIGDPALFLDHERLGIEMVDLGDHWTSMTALPFVWAFWAGRPDVLTRPGVSALLAARDTGVAASDSIAAAYCGPERAALCQAYLRENIRYTLGEREEAGLLRFYDLAESHGIVEDAMPAVFYR
jgi:chorismate dehydratase